MDRQQEQFNLVSTLEALREALPPLFPRRMVSELTCGIISSKTLANLETQKKGPPSFKSTKYVLYDRDTFIPWLKVWLTRGRQNGR